MMRELIRVQSSKCTKVVSMDEKTDELQIVYIHPLPKLKPKDINRIGRTLRRNSLVNQFFNNKTQ